MRLADCMGRLGTETAFEVLARAKALEAQGKSIVHLQIGEPDFDTPRNVVEAGAKALREGHTHYGPAPGLPALREAIANHVAKTRGCKVAPEQVLVTPGGKPIMFYAILALLQEGDEAVYPNPGFPIYESMIAFAGAKPIPAPLRFENDFRMDMQEVDRLVNDKTRLLIVNSPGNPCGNTLTQEDAQALVALLQRRPNLYLLTDEIYSRILYEGKHCSPLSFGDAHDRIILLDGFSKAYAMTGWRLGYGVMHKDLCVACTRLQINVNSCTASFTQLAGVEALNGPQDAVVAMVAEFRRRRDFLVAGLNKIKGVSCKLPGGAFYVLPKVEVLGRDGAKKSSRDVQDLLLNEAGVAALSGTAFGKYGEGFLRFSYANSLPKLEEALRRIERVLGAA